MPWVSEKGNKSNAPRPHNTILVHGISRAKMKGLSMGRSQLAATGYVVVIGVLGARSGTSDVRVDALRLQIMLESGLLLAAFSILPAFLAHFEISASTSWRIASAMFLLIQIPSEFIALRRTRKMPDMNLSRVNVNTVNWGLSIGADLIMLGVLLDWVGAHASGFYMLGVFLLLIMSGLLFIQFAASTFIPAGE